MFLLINKPTHITSHDVIYKLRTITGEQTIGHAGTLDPFAEGLLIVAIGRASTKQLDGLLKLDKTYEATLQLGFVSDTYDCTGKINKKNPALHITRSALQKTLKEFIGTQLQTPPAFSAKKIRGECAYELARKGKTPKLIPQQITIHNINLKSWSNVKSQLSIVVNCTSGTYIRSLAHDIGQKLGTGAYLEKLVRTSIGLFKLKEAIKLEKINPKNWHKFTFKNLPDLPHKKKVLIFGTFDRLHPGHKNMISQTAKLGDELHVIIARDQNVKKIKNKIPAEDELTRLHKVHALPEVTNCHLGQSNLDHRFRILGKIKPDIIALGYDQQIDLAKLKDKIKHYNLKTHIIRLKPHHPEKYKSSLIKSPNS